MADRQIAVFTEEQMADGQIAVLDGRTNSCINRGTYGLMDK